MPNAYVVQGAQETRAIVRLGAVGACRVLVCSYKVIDHHAPHVYFFLYNIRGHGYGTPMGDLRTGRSLDVVRHAGLVRPRSVALRASDDDIDSLFGDSLNDNQEGGRAGWEEDSVEAEDVADLSNEFYSEVRRWRRRRSRRFVFEKRFGAFSAAVFHHCRRRRCC